jgi:hypothetical protein
MKLRTKNGPEEVLYFIIPKSSGRGNFEEKNYSSMEELASGIYR